MRAPFNSFEEASSDQGSSTLGRAGMKNYMQGMQMADNATRQSALIRANQYQIEANEARAKAGMPSPGNDIMGVMSGVEGLVGALTKPAGAPGVNFNDSTWTGATQGFKDFYQSSSFSTGNEGLSGFGSFTPDTSGIDFGSLF